MGSLYEINEKIKLTFENRQLVVVINLDKTKAYDTTWRHETGFANIKDRTKILYKLPPESSIFFAENYTILIAIKLINLTTSNKSILILNDSLSALLALQNPFSTHKITQNIQTEFIIQDCPEFQNIYVIPLIINTSFSDA